MEHFLRLIPIFQKRSHRVLVFCYGMGSYYQPTYYHPVLDRASFIVARESDVLLRGFSYYSFGNCRSPQFPTINTLMKQSMKWKTNKFFPSPVKNFFGCSLVFGVFADVFKRSFKQTSVAVENPTTITTDYSLELIKLTAKILNFTAIFTPVFRKESSPERHTMNHCSKFDLHLAIVDLTGRNQKYLIQPFIFEDVQVLVSPGEEYTKFEKLFLAFELELWVWIAATFAIAFVTIFVVLRMPKYVQRTVFGDEVASPALNVAFAFFGFGQMALPRNTFARVLLLLFIFFSLIFRTAYQGRSFEILQQQIHKPEVQTFDELFGQNYKLHATEYYFKIWENDTLLKKMVLTKFQDYFKLALNIPQEPGSKKALLLDNTQISALKTFTNSNFKFLQDKCSFVMRTVVFPEYFELFDPLNNLVKRLWEAGIMQRLSKSFEKN